MDQRLSRPQRWASATRRATDALWELQELRDQLISLREELVDQWELAHSKFKDAIWDLEVIQNEFEMMNEPENLWDSRFHQKRRAIMDLSFEGMIGRVPDLSAIPDPIEDFNLYESNDDFLELDEAKQAELPKGYGRD